MRLYQQNLNAFAQQTGQLPTNEQAIQMGIPTQVLSQLTTRAAINQFAIRNGVGVSDAKLAELVRQYPTFFGVLGTFDRSIYDQVLRGQGLTSEQYFETQREAARRQQIAIGLFAGSQMSKTSAELLNRYRNDLRTIEYFTLNATTLPNIPEPTEDDLKAYLTENQAKYRTQETRVTELLFLSVEALAALPEYQPTEDELKARVDEILSRHALDYDVTWSLSGAPFVTGRGPLIDTLTRVVQGVTGVAPQLSTGGGTSDGRFLASIAREVAEFGPLNESIHKIDERLALTDIEPLSVIYEQTLAALLERAS